MKQIDEQTIIIIGGLLIIKEAYKEMAKVISIKAKQALYIVNVKRIEWLLTNL
ncbi:hypothetical protein [Prochlorococcus sp. MIT 1223]|uniref:hypothetical protein n=1 Tax=Prochlorococcus sp. MIT 1223 TaxID=3096217 RepID=UPI002A758C4F|nr:hypothetical protein [Prochlorococcus sp. MIT 1223]